MTGYNNNLGPQALGWNGQAQNYAPLAIKSQRAPTVNDRNYPYGQLWDYYPEEQMYILLSVVSGQAQWYNMTGPSGIQTITGNSGGAAGPDGSGNFNIVGTGGVSVTTDSSTNTATISASSSGITWTDKSSSFTASVDEAYFLNSALTLTLPASPTQGQFVYVVVTTTGSFNVAANTGQKIAIGSAISSSGGNAANNAVGDSLELYYRAADAVWWSNSTSSTWTLT